MRGASRAAAMAAILFYLAAHLSAPVLAYYYSGGGAVFYSSFQYIYTRYYYIGDVSYSILCRSFSGGSMRVVVQGVELDGGIMHARLYIFSSRGLDNVVDMAVPLPYTGGSIYAWCGGGKLVVAQAVYRIHAGYTEYYERILGVGLGSGEVFVNKVVPVAVLTGGATWGSYYESGNMVYVNNTLYYARILNGYIAIVGIDASNYTVSRRKIIPWPRSYSLPAARYPYTDGARVYAANIIYDIRGDTVEEISVDAEEITGSLLAGDTYLLLYTDPGNNMHAAAVRNGGIAADHVLGNATGYAPRDRPAMALLPGSGEAAVLLPRIGDGPYIAVLDTGSGEPRLSASLPRGISVMDVFYHGDTAYAAVAAGSSIMYASLSTGRYVVEGIESEYMLVDGCLGDIDGDGYTDVLGVFAEQTGRELRYYVRAFTPSPGDLGSAGGVEPLPEPVLAAPLLLLAIALSAAARSHYLSRRRRAS